MRVIVTGGAGFIGSHIVDALRVRGHQPFVIDNLVSGSRKNVPADVPLFEVDICDAARLAVVFDQVQPECVSHQAAQMSVSRSMREPAFDAHVNVLGLLHVLDNAARVGARRFVFASSGGVLYGEVSEPADEDFPARPQSPYGISKWVGEQYLGFYARERQLQSVALRYANVYGPRQNPHGEAGVVAIFSERMLAGEVATINGDGCYVRDYVYGPDVARANVLALEAELTSNMIAINIGTQVPTDVNQIAECVRTHAQSWCDRTAPPRTVPTCRHGAPREGDLRSSLVAITRAQRLLGWVPTMPLTAGLQETVAWFAEQRE